MAEQSSALDSSSGVVRMWVRIPAWPVVALVSLSKTLNRNCFVLRVGRKAAGPVCCVMHVKQNQLCKVVCFRKNSLFRRWKNMYLLHYCTYMYIQCTCMYTALCTVQCTMYMATCAVHDTCTYMYMYTALHVLYSVQCTWLHAQCSERHVYMYMMCTRTLRRRRKKN